MTKFLRLAASGPAYGLRMIMRPLFAGSVPSEARGAIGEKRDGDHADDALDRVEL
jgi:hypothetical protein